MFKLRRNRIDVDGFIFLAVWVDRLRCDLWQDNQISHLQTDISIVQGEYLEWEPTHSVHGDFQEYAVMSRKQMTTNGTKQRQLEANGDRLHQMTTGDTN
jgi:hypothetical protein